MTGRTGCRDEVDQAMDMLPAAALDAWAAHCADLRQAVVQGQITPDEERRLRNIWGVAAWYRSYRAANTEL